MVAPTLIAAAYNMPGTPEQWKQLPPASAALLIEFRTDDPAELDALEAAANEILSGRPVLDEDGRGSFLPRIGADRDVVARPGGDAGPAGGDAASRRDT